MWNKFVALIGRQPGPFLVPDDLGLNGLHVCFAATTEAGSAHTVVVVPDAALAEPKTDQGQLVGIAGSGRQREGPAFVFALAFVFAFARVLAFALPPGCVVLGRQIEMAAFVPDWQLRFETRVRRWRQGKLVPAEY